MKSKRSKTVSFRIGAALASEVEREAIEGGFQSTHQYVRDICLSALAEKSIRDKVVQLREGLDDIAVELLDLRRDMRSLFTQLLALLIDVSFDEAANLLSDDLAENDPELPDGNTLDDSDWLE